MPGRSVRNTAEDGGFTLVELLVYMLFAVVILTIVGGVLINSLRVETQVRDATGATDSSQLAAQSLGRGIRNSSAIEVSSPFAGALLVRTRSIDSTSAGNWYCDAWSVVDGDLRTTRSSAAIPPPIDPAGVADWTLLAEGVAATGANPIFSLGADGRSLSVAFTVDNGDGVPVLVDTVIVSRQPTPATGRVTAPCF